MNLIHITDPESEVLSVYRDLNEAQLRHYYEPHGGLFVAESAFVLERALAAGYEPESVLCEERKTETVRELLKDADIPVYTAPEHFLTQITGFHLTRGILAACKRKPLPAMEALIQGAERIAILEEVVNPTNVGAIIRSAAALSVDAVLLTRGCADPLNRRAARVSTGNCFLQPWTYIDVSWPEEGMKVLKNHGFTTAALALSDEALDITDPELKKQEKLALILGNEGWGLDKKTQELCDHIVKIPMKEGVDSLNVGAASAIAFWEVLEKKRNNS